MTFALTSSHCETVNNEPPDKRKAMSAMQKKPIPIMLVPLLTLICHQTVSAYYDPGVQRWINRDPLEERGGINLYRFVASNPLRFLDTDGRQIIWLPVPGSPIPIPVPTNPVPPPPPPASPPATVKCPIVPPSQWPAAANALKDIPSGGRHVSVPLGPSGCARMSLHVARITCKNACAAEYGPASQTGYTPAQDKACLKDCNRDCDANYEKNKVK